MPKRANKTRPTRLLPLDVRVGCGRIVPGVPLRTLELLAKLDPVEPGLDAHPCRLGIVACSDEKYSI